MLSAGILLYRRRKAAETEVLLLHQGGPFWARKDAGAWTIPKGLCEAGEELLAAARREFAEETGGNAVGPFAELGVFRLGSGKALSVWVAEGDFEVGGFVSNRFEMEWPPRSGKRQFFPEADRAEWFNLNEAERKLTKGQAPMIGALRDWLASRPI